MRKFAFCALVFLAAFCISRFSGFFPADAGIVDDLKQEIAERQEQARALAQEKKTAQEALTKLDGKERTLAVQISILEAQIDELAIEVAITENDISQTELEIERLIARMAEIEEEIAHEREIIGKVVQAIYERDGFTTVEVVFSADRFSDIFDEIRYVEVLEQELADKLEGLKTLRVLLEEEKGEKEVRKRELEGLSATLAEKKEVLENQQSEKEYLLKTTRREEQTYERLLEDIEDQAKHIQEEIVDFEARLRAAIDLASLPRGSGVLSWPVLTVRITQGYGATSETGFINDAYKFHNGIDFGAAERGVIGDSIYAASAGTVVGLGNTDTFCPRAAYGRWIAIDHGNGLTTMYAHLSAFAVSVGDTVARGEVIGYMGSSGFSTGPHLHFTVYATAAFLIKESNVCGPMAFGASDNPLNYLP